MHDLVLTLDPGKLKNPDLDLLYLIPDLLKERSKGNIKENGYDYEDAENPNAPLLAIFLTATNLPAALGVISQLVLHEVVLENQLSSGAALYVQENGTRRHIELGGDHS